MKSTVKFFSLFYLVPLLGGQIPALMASSKNTGVYAGGGFGMSQLYGKRTDLAVGNNVSAPRYLYTDKRMNDTSLEGNVFVGYAYHPEDTRFVFSLEGFMSYGPYESTVFKAIGPGILSNQTASLKRGMGGGLTIRPGYVLESFTPYLVVGGRADRFFFSSVSSAAESVNKKDNITGIDYGMGVETVFRGLKTGLELKFTQYKNHTFNIIDKDQDQLINKTNTKSAFLGVRFIHVF